MIELLPIHQFVETIISILDARDPYTYEHSWRVAHISELIARKMKINEERIELIHIAAHLHDIGKVGVPDFILNKQGPLSYEEYELMKSHPRIGYNIVHKIEFLKETSKYILHHHEKWDGTGYPDGLQGREIPLGASIISIADCFDAMITRRSYKDEMSIDRAFDEIMRARGTQLCPEVVDCFLTMRDEIPDILKEVNMDIKHHVFKNEENSYLNRSNSVIQVK